MLHTFTDPPVVLALRNPRGWRHYRSSMRGGWYALVASAILTEVRNIQKLELAVTAGEPAVSVTVQPSDRYTIQQALADLDKISERFDGMNPRVLAAEWNATPESKRAHFKIVRDADVQAA